MKYFAYMILFPNGYLYTGSTGDLGRRRKDHRRDLGTGSKVVFKQAFATRDEALAREKQLKGWKREKKEALYLGQKSDLVTLSKRRSGNLFQRPL